MKHLKRLSAVMLGLVFTGACGVDTGPSSKQAVDSEGRQVGLSAESLAGVFAQYRELVCLGTPLFKRSHGQRDQIVSAGTAMTLVNQGVARL